jgi:hypothetical protein
MEQVLELQKLPSIVNTPIEDPFDSSQSICRDTSCNKTSSFFPVAGD